MGEKELRSEIERLKREREYQKGYFLGLLRGLLIGRIPPWFRDRIEGQIEITKDELRFGDSEK